MATLKDIANRVGVTPAVVSRLLRNDKKLRVSDQTRQKILRVAKELNYSPNLTARSLRLSRSNLIAMVVHDVTNPIFGEIITGAQQVAKNHGYSLLLGDADALGPGAKRMTNLIRGGGIDGLLLHGVGAATDLALKNAASKQLRTVLLQEYTGSDYGVVRLPDKRASYLATNYLLELGHRRIGHLGSAEGLRLSKRRYLGWQEALQHDGIEPEVDWSIWSGYDLESGYLGMKRLLNGAKELTAVVVSNAIAAIGGTTAIREMGLKIPQDIALVAIHDIPFALHTAPALTVVKMPLFELGQQAIRMLLGNDEPSGKEITIEQPEPRLIKRGST